MTEAQIPRPRPTIARAPGAIVVSFLTLLLSSSACLQAAPPAGRAFPERIDPETRYLFYLHGRIIEEQGLPAVSQRFGEYRYEDILRALEGEGRIVVSEARPRGTDPDAYAARIVEQIGRLRAAGVPAEGITVIGASKGAFIASLVSSRCTDPEVSYVLLATCGPSTRATLRERGLTFHGRILAIRDHADTELAGSCQEVFERSRGKGLAEHREIVLDIGTGHGILYRPLPEWVEPTLAWSRRTPVR